VWQGRRGDPSPYADWTYFALSLERSRGEETERLSAISPDRELVCRRASFRQLIKYRGIGIVRILPRTVGDKEVQRSRGFCSNHGLRDEFRNQLSLGRMRSPGDRKLFGRRRNRRAALQQFELHVYVLSDVELRVAGGDPIGG
jgi:hypothetical protein